MKSLCPTTNTQYSQIKNEQINFFKKTLTNVLKDGPMLPEIGDPNVSYSTKLLLCLQNPNKCSPSDSGFPTRHSKS